ncbi:MAG: FHA domain-containing protein [Armatimonadota bacterium]
MVSVDTVVTVTTARLTLKRLGELTSEVFQVGNGSVVGRFDDETGPVDVDLASLPEAEYISRRHAQFTRGNDGQWAVKDLGSRNGVFVGRAGADDFEKVTGEVVLSEGDNVALGNARFVFGVN